jgi:hypothetical protein
MAPTKAIKWCAVGTSMAPSIDRQIRRQASDFFACRRALATPALWLGRCAMRATIAPDARGSSGRIQAFENGVRAGTPSILSPLQEASPPITRQTDVARFLATPRRDDFVYRGDFVYSSMMVASRSGGSRGPASAPRTNADGGTLGYETTSLRHPIHSNLLYAPRHTDAFKMRGILLALGQRAS